MLRALLIFTVSIFFSACTQRVICPAFQSAFIYDKDALRKKYSYFQGDSTPKVFTASKTKYLIAEAQPYRKKVRDLQTVPMEPVYVALPDSFKIDNEGLIGEDGVVAGSELDMAARSIIDSTFIVDVPQAEAQASAEDTVYVISKDKEVRLLKYNTPDSLIYDPASGKYVPQLPTYAVVDVTFNVEQDNYMWYLRDYLVLPDVRLAQMQQGAGDSSTGEAKSQKGLKGFFKNLFKKKPKAEPEPDEELQPQQTEEEEFDYVDEDEQAQPLQTAPETEEKKKKGLFSRKKKDKQTRQQEPVEEEQDEEEQSETTPVDPTPPINLEPQDDGF